ncbi:MAG: thioredoxin 1 [Cyclobacteriaceae bacterium]|jgi:thioredoxin 1
MSKKSFQELIQGSKPVLVDFSATWCGPCKMMEPILKDVKNKLGDTISVIKIDIDKNPKVAQSHKVQGVPTLIIYKEGAIVWRQSGVIPEATLTQVLSSHQ